MPHCTKILPEPLVSQRFQSFEKPLRKTVVCVKNSYPKNVISRVFFPTVRKIAFQKARRFVQKAFRQEKFFDCLRPKKTACYKAMHTRKAPETAALAVFCGARGNTLSQNAAVCTKKRCIRKRICKYYTQWRHI